MPSDQFNEVSPSCAARDPALVTTLHEAVGNVGSTYSSGQYTYVNLNHHFLQVSCTVIPQPATECCSIVSSHHHRGVGDERHGLASLHGTHHAHVAPTRVHEKVWLLRALCTSTGTRVNAHTLPSEHVTSTAVSCHIVSALIFDPARSYGRRGPGDSCARTLPSRISGKLLCTSFPATKGG